MTHDYLWDRSGVPDPFIAELETSLGALAYQPLRLASAPVKRRRRAIPLPLVAAAAMMLLASAAAVLCPPSPSPWRIEPIEGAPAVGSVRLVRPDALRANEWVQTDRSSSAVLFIEGLGQVRINPGTRLRIAPAPAGTRRLDLARGSIHAFVTAPPRLFQVDTPCARAVDLGCEYALEVDESGAGQLRVLLGYVQLEWGGAAVTIPMGGGTCLTRPGFGPGTPFFDDASPRLIDELRRFDFESGGEPALNAVLSEARPRDALTLWHLLERAAPDLRGTVYDRLAQLKPPPQGVVRSGVLALDRAMLSAWWDAMRPF